MSSFIITLSHAWVKQINEKLGAKAKALHGVHGLVGPRIVGPLESPLLIFSCYMFFFCFFYLVMLLHTFSSSSSSFFLFFIAITGESFHFVHVSFTLHTHSNLS